MKMIHVALVLLMTASMPALVRAQNIHAALIGYQEVPSVSTPASGQFHAKISDDGTSLSYELTFGDLIGTVQQSHIHVAQRGVNGSIVVWLCQTTTTPAPASVAATTPFCPQSGTVTGTITAANVVTASTASQQIVAGELDEVIAAIRAGVAYVNVHATPLNPGGEIRGQIQGPEKPDRGNDGPGRGPDEHEHGR
jgi:hypothetical protein